MRDDWLRKLMSEFDKIVSSHRVFRELYAVI
jgi:hypothetical protein